MRTIAATSSGVPRCPIGGTAGRWAGCAGSTDPAPHGVDAARHDAIDGDSFRCEIQGERLRHARQSGFRGHDVRAARGAAVAGLAADVDDRAAACAGDVGRAGLRAQEGAVEDHRQHAAPIGERHRCERLLGPDRGIVHEGIDSSEALDGGLHHRGHGVGIGHVGDVAPRAATGGLDIAHRLVHIGVGMQRIDHHVGAAGGERARDRPADVAGAAGDQRDFPVQFPAFRVAHVHPWRCVPQVSHGEDTISAGRE